MQNHHETPDDLSQETREYIRALNSLKEEIEAIDWYQQRLDATADKQMKKILIHNRDEEIEHACMMLEWIRRYMDGWNERLQIYLFTEKDIVKIRTR
jgi:ferritin-like protein